MVATSDSGSWKAMRVYVIMVTSLEPKVPKEIPSALTMGETRNPLHLPFGNHVFLSPILLIKTFFGGVITGSDRWVNTIFQFSHVEPSSNTKANNKICYCLFLEPGVLCVALALLDFTL